MRFGRFMGFVSVALLMSGCALFGPRAGKRLAVPKIDAVYLAQHHVLEPTDPYCKLVGDLEALIKVQVYSDNHAPSPYVFAKLQLGDKSREIRLLGPKTLPKPAVGDPVFFKHTYDDSFTAIIPRQWVRPGLNVIIELRDYDYVNSEDDKDFVDVNQRREITVLDSRTIDGLKVGAPTKMVMHMFDIHYFGRGLGADYPQGWEDELKAKMPFSELDIRRVRNLVFAEVVIPPAGHLPATRIHSAEELEKHAEAFQSKNKRKFSHVIGLLGYRWADALKRAGSGSLLYRSYCINSAGIYSSGRGSRYCAANHLHRRGLVIHELGHAYGLPHWMGKKDYPYARTMYGRDMGKPTKPNAGPKWAFNLHTREFLPPYVMVDGKLVWIHDPMHGGGKNRHGTGVYTHFSDYSMRRMQQRIESRGVCWNAAIGKYAMWNQESGRYDKVVENDGLKLPLERDVEVTSLLFSVSGTVPSANIIYPPIGPYVAGLVRVFDANSEADRKDAVTLGHLRITCNVAVRVTQGGTVKSYLLPATIASNDKLGAFHIMALNLPTRDGKVTKAELIRCPDLMTKGVTRNHDVLAVWPKEK